MKWATSACLVILLLAVVVMMASISESSVPVNFSAATPSICAGSKRNPRRSSVPSRVIIGLDESFTEELRSDEEDFFGSDDESTQAVRTSDSSEDEGHVVETWSSDGEQHKVSEEVATAAASAGDPGADVTEEDISVVQSVLYKGCGCDDAEHIKSLPAKYLVVHKKRFASLSARERDLYLSGILANASCVALESSHSGKLQDKARQRVTYSYSVMSFGVCRTGFLKLYGIGCSHLKRIYRI